MSNPQGVQSYNQLEAKSIQLVIDRIPNVNFFCTSASVPGIASTAVRQPSPFADVKVTGDKIMFQPLIVNFIVDENMANWKEIFDWMVSYAHPTEFDEYADATIPQNRLYASKKSDATLIVPNNKYNATHEFSYVDIFPVDMTDIIFDTQIDDVPNIICTVTFEYTSYKKTK